MAKNKNNNFKNNASSGSSKNNASGTSKSNGSMKDTHAQVPGSGPSRSGPGGE